MATPRKTCKTMNCLVNNAKKWIKLVDKEARRSRPACRSDRQAVHMYMAQAISRGKVYKYTPSTGKPIKTAQDRLSSARAMFMHGVYHAEEYLRCQRG